MRETQSWQATGLVACLEGGAGRFVRGISSGDFEGALSVDHSKTVLHTPRPMSQGRDSVPRPRHLRCTRDSITASEDSIIPRCSHYQSVLAVVYVYVVPWSEFPIVPAYPHYPHPCDLPLRLSRHNTQHRSSRQPVSLRLGEVGVWFQGVRQRAREGVRERARERARKASKHKEWLRERGGLSEVGGAYDLGVGVGVAFVRGSSLMYAYKGTSPIRKRPPP